MEPPDNVGMRPTMFCGQNNKPRCKSKCSQQDRPAEKDIRTKQKICVARRYL